MAEQPFTFYVLGQKFVLKWGISDPESSLSDTFALEANGAELDSLEYMVPNFKLVEIDVVFFDATVTIDGILVHSGHFEWRSGTLSHKIAEKI